MTAPVPRVQGDGDTTHAGVKAYPQKSGTAARRRGWQAAAAGRALSDCPYVNAEFLRQEWVDGWALQIVAAHRVADEFRRRWAMPAARPERRHAHWSDIELRASETFHVERMPVRHQARALGRTYAAVREQRRRRGMVW